MVFMLLGRRILTRLSRECILLRLRILSGSKDGACEYIDDAFVTLWLFAWKESVAK